MCRLRLRVRRCSAAFDYSKNNTPTDRRDAHNLSFGVSQDERHLRSRGEDGSVVNSRVVGKIGYAYSKILKRGRVISQKPVPLTVLRKGAKVSLVVSRGRKP